MRSRVEVMFRFACSLLMVCNLAEGFQQSTEARQDKDVYAIYSLLLTNPETSHGKDDNPRYLIAGTTVQGIPEEPCIQPPHERKIDFQEALAEYHNRSKTMRRLEPALVIPKPYFLLSPDDVSDFMKREG